jgi:hypothetical protein
MFTLVNTIENKIIANLKNQIGLIDKIRSIAIENEDFDFTILGLSDAIEYVEDYCDNLAILTDSEVEEFLFNHGIEVGENEPDNYVELMMDNHKCAEWKGKQYYISDSLSLNEDEEKIYDVLAYALHV